MTLRFRSFLVASAIIALACLPYTNTLWNGYVFDDVLVYSENPFVSNPANLKHLFSHAYFDYSLEASYRPVCTATYFLDRAMYGSWSPGPHLTNLVLYGTLSALLFILFRSLLHSDRAAGLGAACFALHPVHSEVVNSIGFREDMLVPLFLIVSWLCFRRGGTGAGWPWMVVAWLAYGLALLSKESAVVFPALAILLGWHTPRVEATGDGYTRRHILTYGTGILLLSLLYLLLRFKWMQFDGEAEVPRLGGTLARTLLANVRIQARYVAILLWPVDLRALYVPADFPAQLDGRFWISLLFLSSLASATLYFRRLRLIPFTFLWWFLCLAPVANIYPIFNPMAERYLFMPSIGPSLLAGALLDRSLQGPRRIWVVVVAVVVALWFAVLTAQRNPAWADSVTMWSRLHKSAPTDSLVLGNLATAHYRAGQHKEAAEAAMLALIGGQAVNPAFQPAPAHNVLGCVSYHAGDIETALVHFMAAEAALPCRPDVDIAVYENLALSFRERGDWTLAAEYFTRAAHRAAFRTLLWTRAAHARLQSGETDTAADLWEHARRLDTNVPPFHALVSAIEANKRTTHAPQP